MSDFIDYYEVLQVHRKAEPEVIAKAYRALMLKYHPDQSGKDGERARLINEAYEVLSEPRKRAEYDSTLKTAQRKRREFGGYFADLEADLAAGFRAQARMRAARLDAIKEGRKPPSRKLR